MAPLFECESQLNHGWVLPGGYPAKHKNQPCGQGKNPIVMKEKYTTLLEGLLAKLDDQTFDLAAWKSAAIPLLETIFGQDNPKTRQIEPIKIEYGSSWTMRDVTGDYDPVGSAKKRCREVIRLALGEIEALGLPEPLSAGARKVGEALEEELKVAQTKALKKIVHSTAEGEDKQQQLVKKLASFGPEACAGMLARVILAIGMPE